MGLKRSKSECALEIKSSGNFSGCSRSSASSAEVLCFAVNDSNSDSEESKHDVFGTLEDKIDKLNDLFLEQCRLLTGVKEDLRDSKTAIEKYEDVQNKLLKTSLMERYKKDKDQELAPSGEEFNSRARSLLNAIEMKQNFDLDRELRNILVDLIQSDELKQNIVSATMDSLQGMVAETLSRDVSQLYLPVLQRANRRLARQVTRTIEDGFLELEANSVKLSNSMCRVSQSLRRALDQHRGWLQAGQGDCLAYISDVIEETMKKELEAWREKAQEAQGESEGWPEDPPLEGPDSPPQPADPDSSVIDQLMKTAIIRKQIEDGDINLAFSSALSASDLSLVVAACRAAAPERVFAPCRLDQTVLLSLAQQLPTDMVHDTQLKCRYLEETLINLDPTQPATRTHLPLVVGEIRKHLNNFLTKYPSHIASRRITLIIMATDKIY